jgi:hypothetical protein
MLGRIESGPFQERDDAVVQNNEAQSWAVVIANGASVSDEVELGPYVLCGIIMPAAWTAADLSYQVRGHTTGWVDMCLDGDELTDAAAADQYVIVDPADFAGARFLRIRSGTTGTPVAQGAERTLVLVVRPV